MRIEKMMRQDWLSDRRQATPERTALLFEGQRYSYAQLDDKVNELAGRLAAAGVGVGTHTAVYLPSGVSMVVMLHALARLQAVMVPLNLRLTAKELVWQLEKADVEVLIMDKPMPELAGDWQSFSLDNLPAPIEFDASEFDETRVQSIIFTSGTTGSPKGAQLTFANHFWSAMASAYRLGVLPDDRWLAAMPLYHVGGMAILLRACMYGIGVVLQDGFDEQNVMRAIREDGVSLVSVVPTMLHRLMQDEDNIEDLRSLRVILVGGAAASTQLVQACLDAELPISLTYGLTEAASQVATAAPEEVLAKPGTLGKPLMYSSVRILNEEGEENLPNEIGEIVVSGRTVMKGYYPDTNLDKNLYTGDLGYMDEAGDLYVIQRRVDLVVCGGENVYPSEVEQVMLDYPGIEMVCVTGIDDVEWCELVAAGVVPQADIDLDEQAIMDFCREQLAGYKVPRKIYFFDALPQTASGKIKRKEVRELVTQKFKEEPVRA